jgi:CheY-like chemotaxis protein
MSEEIRTLRRFAPDLIIVDPMMKEYDSGIVFCKRVREMDVTKDTPIIMQTSALDEIGFTPASGGSRLQADEVLTKTVELSLLLTKIREHLGERDG